MWIYKNSHQIIWKLLQFSKQVLISSSSFLSYLKSFAIFPLSCELKIHSRRKLSTSFGGGWASNLYTISPFCSSSYSSLTLRQQEIAQIENENGKLSSFPLQSSLILSCHPLPPQKTHFNHYEKTGSLTADVDDNGNDFESALSNMLEQSDRSSRSRAYSVRRAVEFCTFRDFCCSHSS